ncbi:MAG: RNA-binding S4 domain-containing protein [Pseudomonadota bacterium]
MSGEDDATVAASGAPTAAGQRLDKWLWFARIVKTRSLATSLVQQGRIRVNRVKVSKPSHTLRVGDVITATVHSRLRVLEVCDPGKRRGPAPEAQTLYRDLTPPPAPKPDAAHAAQSTAGRPRREPGAGRPTKRDRRQMDQLRKSDSGSA